MHIDDKEKKITTSKYAVQKELIEMREHFKYLILYLFASTQKKISIVILENLS